MDILDWCKFQEWFVVIWFFIRSVRSTCTKGRQSPITSLSLMRRTCAAAGRSAKPSLTTVHDAELLTSLTSRTAGRRGAWPSFPLSMASHFQPASLTRFVQLNELFANVHGRFVCTGDTQCVRVCVSVWKKAAALVHIYKDGSVLVTHGGTEMGQGIHTKMQQVLSLSH